MEELTPGQLERFASPLSCSVAKLVTDGHRTSTQANSPLSQELLNFFRVLPPHAAGSLIRSTTLRLEQEALALGWDCVAPRIVRSWIPVILQSRQLEQLGCSDLDRHQIEGVIAGPRRIDLAVAYLQGRNRVEIADFVLRFWVRHDLSCASSTAHDVDQTIARLREQLRNCCATNPKASPFTQLMSVLFQGRLPFENAFCAMVLLLRGLGLWKDVARVFRSGRRNGLLVRSELLGEHISIRSSSNLIEAKALFSQFADLKLHSCGDFAINMISNPKGAAAFPWARLKAEGPWKYFRHRPGSRRKTLSLDPRIGLVRRMALAYAYAEHLSPSQAFKYTYRCYRYLKDRGVKVGPEVSRALAYAGITCSLQSDGNLTDPKLEAILRAVRGAEGEHIESKLDEVVLHWKGFNVDWGPRPKKSSSQLKNITNGSAPRVCSVKAPGVRRFESGPANKLDLVSSQMEGLE
ncbi:MAG: proteasome core particle subunit beta 2 [Chaenotheca gracillima]|nr:MAG: proteasome core particle subunit beta 2 [Chaenotheca gracillima]